MALFGNFSQVSCDRLYHMELQSIRDILTALDSVKVLPISQVFTEFHKSLLTDRHRETDELRGCDRPTRSSLSSFRHTVQSVLSSDFISPFKTTTKNLIFIFGVCVCVCVRACGVCVCVSVCVCVLISF